MPLDLSWEEARQLTEWMRRAVQRQIDDVKLGVKLALNRGHIHLINDSHRVQELQAEVLVDEVINEVEHFQPYGLSAHPPRGSVGLMATCMDSRDEMIAVCVNSPPDRPTGLEEGEVTVFAKFGQRITLHENGDISLTPGVGPKGPGKVRLGSQTADVGVVRATDVMAATGAMDVWATAVEASLTAAGFPSTVLFSTSASSGMARPATSSGDVCSE